MAQRYWHKSWGGALPRNRPHPIPVTEVVDLQRVDAVTLADALDGLAINVFLVNRRGFPVHVNAGGRAMLAAKDPLRVVRGTLIGATDQADRTLSRVLSAAIGDGSPAGASEIGPPLTGADGRHFVVNATRLGGSAQRQADSGVAPVAALFVREARIDLDAAIETATQVYDFTLGEARVLKAVIEIGGIPAVTAALGLSRPTIKSHLAQLFEKTGCRRQAELVRLIAGFESPARKGSRISRSADAANGLV